MKIMHHFVWALTVGCFTSASLFASPAAQSQEDLRGEGRVTYYRVSSLETLDGEAVSSGVLLVRDGIIEKLGKAVSVPKGARVRDFRRQGSVAMPPFVLAHADFQVGKPKSSSNSSHYLAKDMIWLDQDWGTDLLEQGILMVGLNPQGSILPGRTSVLRTDAGYPQPEAVYDDLHLVISLESAGSRKTAIRQALADADAAIQKEKDAKIEWRKEREAWEKKQKEKEEAAKKEKEQKDSGGAEESAQSASEPKPEKASEEEAPPAEFEPPKLDQQVEAVVEWIRGQRIARVQLASASSWLHWLELIGDREVAYELEFSRGWRGDSNLFKVLEGIAAAGVRVDLPATISFLPSSRNRLNLPAEAVAAGVEQLILTPPSRVSNWRRDVAGLVADGLDRNIALRAMTLEPASALGLETVIQPLKSGSPAHFVIWNGDPLDTQTEVLLVIADGEVVWDRAAEEEKKS